MAVINLAEKQNLLRQLQSLKMEKEMEIDIIREKSRQMILQQMSATNERIDSSLIIYTTRGEGVNIASLFKAKEKLILRIPLNSCGLCYDQSLKFMNEMVHIIGKEDLIVLLPKGRGREFTTFFKENNCVDLQQYYIDDIVNISILDNNSIPFFFTTYPDLTCHNHLYLDKEPDEFLFEYLTLMKERVID
jgi:hypothetical protein